ncbi:MAG: bifunctional riboflavin kinase/FAD synthetase [Lachnospirales bacterium]
MIVYDDNSFQIKENTAVTIGNFDGVHLGHQKLIETVLGYSRNYNLKSVMFSFNPHPVAFFGRKGDFKTMFSVEEKKFIASKTGVEVLIQYPFNMEFASMSPTEFIDLLIEKTNCKVLVVGENYCFGKDRIGNIDILRHLGDARGIKVIGIPRVKVENIRVSSTRIRNLICEGDMEKTAYLLKKPYFVIGEVVEGDKRGRTMNFPTINLEPNKKKLLPPDGVYFSTVIIDGKKYYGVSNIGLNPTFNGERRKIETHILNFNDDVYGKKVIVTFYKKIRDEKKFENMNSLALQMTNDKVVAESFINKLEVLKFTL